jgi:hypothetical protein
VDQLVSTVERVLRTHRFRFAGERELQAGIDQVLRAAGLNVTREAALGDAGTIDFLIDDLGLEIKVRGTRADVTRQIHRYLQHDAIRGVMVVTTRAELARLPSTISGKPVFAHHLVSGAW